MSQRTWLCEANISTIMPEIESLWVHTITHAERLLMAASLDAINIPLIQSHRRGPLSIHVNNITGANRERVSNIGRTSLPDHIAKLLANSMTALLGLNFDEFASLITQAKQSRTWPEFANWNC